MPQSEPNLNRFYADYMNKLKQKAAEAVKKALAVTWQEFFVSVEANVRDIFNDVIQHFYADYEPLEYHRTESLYNLLQTRLSPNGDSLSIWFEPSEMSSFRSGYSGEDGLYDQVFRHGWHGGADTIADSKVAKYGAHPDPGVPYWRTPSPYYTHWGRQAQIASRAPLEDFRMRIAEYQQYAMMTEFNRIWERNKSNIKIDI